MIKELTIQLGGKQYKIKKTYRSLLLYEEETGKLISEMKQSIKDLLILFYCIIKANNTIDFTFTQFIDMIDNEPQIMDNFNNYLVDSATTIKDEPVKKKKVNH